MNPVTRPVPIDSLTTLRGLLASWVVLYHFANDLTRLFPSLHIADPFFHKGGFAVPAFFVLSGFVLSYNYATRFQQISTREVVRFWALRFARIYPIHFVTLLTVAAMVGVAHQVGFTLTDSGYSTRDFVLNLFLMHTWVPDFRLNWNYPSWSVSSEWFAYLTFPFAVGWMLPLVVTPARAWGLIAVCLAGMLAVYLSGPFPFRELVCVIPTFFAGIAIYAVTRGRPTATSAVARRLPEVFATIALAACFLIDETGTSLLLVGLIGMIWALARVSDRPYWVWVTPVLVYLGEVSYSLYMTHTLAQKVLYKLLPAVRFEDSSFAMKCGVAVIYILLITAWCLAMYYLVEKPGRDWFRRRLDNAA